MSEKDEKKDENSEKPSPPVIPKIPPTPPVIPPPNPAPPVEPPVLPVLPSPPTIPTKVLVRELRREPANIGDRNGSVTWEQPTALQTRQYPLWYRYRAAFGSLIIVNVCIGTYMLFTVKPKPKGSKKGKAIDKSGVSHFF